MSPVRRPAHPRTDRPGWVRGLLALLAALPLLAGGEGAAAPPPAAGSAPDTASWHVNLVTQSDSRGELRPCT